jgi:NADPH:quinone reductase-like Zn-dependent oxidoreductase
VVRPRRGRGRCGRGVGKDVERFGVGDAVFGEGAGGGCGEYLTLKEANVVAIPDGVSFEAAAATPVAALTALQGLRTHADVQPGERVLINGAAGGVGTMAVQIAKALGAHVTAVCSTRNVEMVRALGADDVIDYTRDDFVTGGARFDVMLDNVGNRRPRTAAACWSRRTLRRGQRTEGEPVARPAALSVAGTVGVRAGGCIVPPVHGVADVDDLTFIGELLASGRLVPEIDRVVGLDGVAEALAEIGSGHARAKIVVTSRIARRRVDLDPLEGCPQRRPEGLESLRRATPVVGEPQPEHAQAVSGSFPDGGQILSIQAQGGTATLPDWRGHDRLAHDGRDHRRFERCRQRETPGEAHPDHADPGTATLTVCRRGECPQPPDDGARAVGQLGELPRHADLHDRSQDLAAVRRGCGAPVQGRQVHGVLSDDQPTGEVDDAGMQPGDLVEHENRWPRTTPEDLIRAPAVREVERSELRADLLAETHTDCSHPWFAQHGRGQPPTAIAIGRADAKHQAYPRPAIQRVRWRRLPPPAI